MNELVEIKQPIKTHLEEFEERFRSMLQSDMKLLNTITQYLYRNKGKQMRPMFVYFSAKMCGNVTETTHTAAVLIETLHTATLIHDDVVDDSNKRRGFFSINALWKNKIAVLLGDYLLSKGLLLSLDNDEFELLKIISNATKEMSEGEILQLEKARKLDVEEDVYFEIIRKKTASLIASCCQAGAFSAAKDKETIEKMRLFGEQVGIAFQIKDDLIDFDNNTKSGKPKGIDIKEKKLTLPLIYLLRNSSKLKKFKLLSLIRLKSSDPKTVKYIIDEVNNSNGIKYATEKMLEYQQKAIDILHTFPESETRDSLEKLVIFTTSRNK
ncbi:MAG: polyprenyl synthetase family protein [Lentimicrobiaceae bacterium]|nr:polyprenyl synthetase family protein [Lentimicrobiaceae bacterium]